MNKRVEEEMLAASLPDQITVVISDNPKWVDELNLFEDEPFVVLPGGSDMFDVLVTLGFFKSKRDAKQNWTKTGREIEFGLSGYVIGKAKKPVWILNTSDNRNISSSQITGV